MFLLSKEGPNDRDTLSICAVSGCWTFPFARSIGRKDFPHRRFSVVNDVLGGDTGRI